MKKLYRSQRDKMVAGILGGLADYFHVDATLLRLLFVILGLLTAIVPFIIFYVIAAIIIPDEGSVIR